MFHDSSMTPDEQWDWLNRRQRAHYDWAGREHEVRRIAWDVMERLHSSDGHQTISVAVYSGPGGSYADSFRTLHFSRANLVDLGGLEGRLLIEEVVRRAIGLPPT